MTTNYGRGRSAKPKMHILIGDGPVSSTMTYCKRFANGHQCISKETAKQIGLDSKNLCSACVKWIKPAKEAP